MHRTLAVFTRGMDLPALLRQLLGKASGYTRGRGRERSFHFGVLAHHVVGMIGHLAAMMRWPTAWRSPHS